MRRILASMSLVIALAAASTGAQAGVDIRVDLSAQRMTVSEDGRVRHVWSVSSGRPGYRTPTGSYRPYRLERMHLSRTYDLAPMPHSIFFRGGYAIHGTGEVRRLGRTASHGCIRLSRGQAAALFRLVGARGMGDTRITITGDAALADGGAGSRVVARGGVSRASAPRRAARWDEEPLYGDMILEETYDAYPVSRRGRW
ncbi:L,D-transpeptidase [Salinarimonas soli]|uniref:L,D-transpeptidase n=1 Tax=Salinarimonas soli TaxID=1638099 RepID=UPI001AEEEA20|nr:L,D-transpeptidase [Salinarimonas soli]